MNADRETSDPSSLTAQQQQLTGDRATRKVRKLARLEHPRFGELRHVEATYPNAGAWSVAIAFVLFGAIGPMVFGDASALDGLIQFVAFAILTGTILLYLGSEKLLVFERGIAVGSLAPLLKPYTFSFADIDATTIRATTGSARALGKLLYGRGVGRTSRTVLWSRYAITFMALSPNNRARVAALTAGPAHPGALASELWVFSVRRPSRQAPLVHALQEAMVKANIPGAADIQARALPTRRIRGTIDDADHLCIPERWRSRDLRRP